jgi:hypothetical protein
VRKLKYAWHLEENAIGTLTGLHLKYCLMHRLRMIARMEAGRTTGSAIRERAFSSSIRVKTVGNDLGDKSEAASNGLLLLWETVSLDRTIMLKA